MIETLRELRFTKLSSAAELSLHFDMLSVNKRPRKSKALIKESLYAENAHTNKKKIKIRGICNKN